MIWWTIWHAKAARLQCHSELGFQSISLKWPWYSSQDQKPRPETIIYAHDDCQATIFKKADHMQETEAIVRRLAQLPSLQELHLKYECLELPRRKPKPDPLAEAYELKRRPKPLVELGAQGFIEICCWALKDFTSLTHLTLGSSMDKVTLTRYIPNVCWICNVRTMHHFAGLFMSISFSHWKIVLIVLWASIIGRHTCLAFVVCKPAPQELACWEKTLQTNLWYYWPPRAT